MNEAPVLPDEIQKLSSATYNAIELLSHFFPPGAVFTVIVTAPNSMGKGHQLGFPMIVTGETDLGPIIDFLKHAQGTPDPNFV